MRQCPDCETKNRVMIAGKVFCANCGTPWQPAEQKEYDQYVASLTPAPATQQPTPSINQAQPNQSTPTNQNPTVVSSADDSAAVAALSAASTPQSANSPQPTPTDVEIVPAPEPVSSAPVPAVDTATTMPTPPTPASSPTSSTTPVVPINISSPLDNLASAAPASTSAPTPVVSPPKPTPSPMTAPIPTPLPPVAAPSSSQPASISISTKSTASRLATATDINKSASVNKFHQPVKSDNPDSAAPSNTPALTVDNATSAVRPPVPAVDSPPTVSIPDGPALATEDKTPDNKDLSEHVGVEISDIESKNDGVLSDNQFKELNKIKAEQPETAPPVSDFNAVKSSDNVPTLPPANQAPIEQKTTENLPATPVATSPQAEPKTSSVPAPSERPIYSAATTMTPNAVRSMTDVVPAPKISTDTPLNKLAEQPVAPITKLPSANQAQPTPLATSFMPARPATVSTAPVNTPVAAASPSPAAKAETTTVAGLTMSKEAAMKLALETDTNKNTGEASIGKAFKPSSVALSIVGLLLIGAYIWQVNYPNLALKVAGNRAGIAINLPNYLPSDWKLSGPIQSQPGSISYNLANDKKDHQIAVTAAKTDWDSQALADNYVATKSDSYLALQSQGLTVYVYGDNQASWVNNGKWYRLEGSSSGLSQDQIIKMATSL